MKIKFSKFKKISWKLTFIYSIIFSIVLILLSASVLFGVKIFLNSQAINQLNNISSNIVQKIGITSKDQTPIYSSQFLDDYQMYPDVYIKITDSNGNIINSIIKKSVSTLDVKSKVNNVNPIEINEFHLLVKNNLINIDAQNAIYVQVIIDVTKDYFFIKILFILMGFTDFIGILVSIFVGYIISKRILNPIDKITKAARSISINDLSEKLEVNETGDELAELSKTLNEMLERLRNSFVRQNQFVSDASHELRTPISVIKGYAQLIDRWGKDDRKILEESIIAIKNEADNMNKLIERLLFIARADVGNLKPDKKEISLSDLIKSIVEETKLYDHDHNFKIEINNNILLFADEKLMQQLFRIIIDNSIKYTPNNGTITINIAEEKDYIKISIKDTGIGIPKDELSNIFDRFYRVDKTRNKDTGGSGIGLSIAKWIVELHNGKISAKSVIEKGTTIIVEIPNENRRKK